MQTITQAFQHLDYLMEAFSALIALAGLLIAWRGHRVAGALIALGASLHLLGYSLLLHRDLDAPLTPITSLLISTMYPGLLLQAAGICYLALTIRRPSSGA